MQSLGLKFFGFVLLLLLIFLTVGTLSFSTADPPDSLVYPQPETFQNLCGPIGAWTVSLLLNALGYAALFLFIPIVVESYRLFRGTPFDQPVLRTAGLCFVLLGLSMLCAFFAPRIACLPCPVIGPGGYLGTATFAVLNRFVAPVGCAIFSSSFVLGGLILMGDRTLLALFRGVGSFFRFAATPQSIAIEYIDRNDRDESDYEEYDEPEAETLSEAAVMPLYEQQPQAAGIMSWLRPRQEARPNRMERQATRIVQTAQENEDDRDYQLPSIELLTPPEPVNEEEYVEMIRLQAEVLETALADFGLKVQVVDIQTGPVVSMFELKLPKGQRLNKVTGLAKELSMVMKNSVRIVAPIPGKDTVGIEVPNEQRQTVRLRDVMEQLSGVESKMNIPIFLGKDVSGQPMALDLTKLPHLLIAGSTGTGKSVCLNSLIVSMLMTRTPEQVRMLMIDPKMVELSPYKTIPHLMHPVVTDMKKAEAILGWAVQKMEERYQLLAAAGVRQLSEFNKLSEDELRRRMNLKHCSEAEWEAIPKSMPYLVIIADEMADLMMTAAKEVETHIIRLAQKSRAVGIHLVLATQKPTVDVITGLIKSNLPARIAFRVASRSDSMVVLDQTGADQLLGNGDMLVLKPGTSLAARGQGTYLGDDEIESIIELIGTDEQDFVEELMAIDTDSMDEETATAAGSGSDEKDQRDELYNEAVEYIIQEGRGSLSLLQRRFSIGYGRAARLIDFMAEDGVVGAYNGSQAREVLMTLSDWRRRGGGGVSAARVSAPVRRDAPKPIPSKPAVLPRLIDTSNEPRQSRKYPEPQFADDYEDETEYYEEYAEYEEDYEEDYVSS